VLLGASSIIAFWIIGRCLGGLPRGLAGYERRRQADRGVAVGAGVLGGADLGEGAYLLVQL